MKIFLSYSSAQRAIAEPLSLALEAEGHDVFFDRHDLPAGDAYNSRIREAIADADRFVFLVSPESLREGSYAQTELKLAQARWPRPGGRVLPVMAKPTPFDLLPPYLGAVTVMQPAGNLVAAVAAHFGKPPWWRRRWWWLAVPVVLMSIGGLAWLAMENRAQVRKEETAAAQSLELERQRAAVAAFGREVSAAANLCAGGNHAAAWANFEALSSRLASQPGPAAAALVSAQADCGMAWLRGMSVSEGQRFDPPVQKILPALGREMATAQGVRLGDLHAHLGWADWLRGRDGIPTQPGTHYERALAVDDKNPYALAMWAHNAELRREGEPASRARRFEAALASGRERSFVRDLQLAAADSQGTALPPTLRSLHAGMLAGEAAPRGSARLYRRWCEWDLPAAQERGVLLGALGVDDALALIDWLQPLDAVPTERRPLWHLCRSAYLMHAGRHAQAEALIRQTLKEMGPSYQGGSYERWAKLQLARFR